MDVRDRVRIICLRLPQATVEGDRQLMFRVRGRSFAYFHDDHHGDGEVSVVVKADDGMNTALIEADPKRFYMPAYVGPRGWVALRLKGVRTDWSEIEDLIDGSYRMVAPRSLIAMIDDRH